MYQLPKGVFALPEDVFGLLEGIAKSQGEPNALPVQPNGKQGDVYGLCEDIFA
ncbi:MAG TPA: hypothetical protein PL045_10010 [Chitinophagaceae bacterium]|nr:hypothetical protein [Chitinophagaceae bacterium]